jgi:hypothetical protein
MATLDRSDEAARVIDLLGRVSLRLWMQAGDATRAGNDGEAAHLTDLSDECDAACVMLTPHVLEKGAA